MLNQVIRVMSLNNYR